MWLEVQTDVSVSLMRSLTVWQHGGEAKWEPIRWRQGQPCRLTSFYEHLLSWCFSNPSRASTPKSQHNPLQGWRHHDLHWNILSFQLHQREHISSMCPPSFGGNRFKRQPNHTNNCPCSWLIQDYMDHSVVPTFYISYVSKHLLNINPRGLRS